MLLTGNDSDFDIGEGWTARGNLYIARRFGVKYLRYFLKTLTAA